MGTNWFDQLILLGALQGFILAVVIWKKKNANIAVVRLLATLLILTSFILIGRVFYLTTFLKQYWLVYTYTDIIIFLFGPIIYFFTSTLLGNKLPNWPNLRWHFLPTIIHLLIFNTIISLALSGIITSISRFQLVMMYFALEFFAIVSMSIYLWKSIRLFNDYESAYYHSFSFPVLSSFLKPFLYFFSFLTIIWGIAFAFKVANQFGGNDGSLYYGFWTLAAISTYLLSYKILLNPDVLHVQQFAIPAQPETNKNTAGVDEDTDLELKNQLTELIKTTRIYQNPKLSLEDLAQSMQISRHELSRIINQGFGKNFFDLINSYRIIAFIKIYSAGDNLTFLEVAYEVGFNSKSAFNRAFRKEKGTSPSEYFRTQPNLQEQTQ
jgi:AraC-like DNA-binding protein